MRVGLLAALVSPRGGGISEIVRQLGRALVASSGVEVVVVGLRDDRYPEPVSAWAPAELHLAHVVGPNLFGYSPDLVPKLCELCVDIVHTNVLWMYPSIACLRWKSRTHGPHMVTLHGMLDSWALRNSRWKKILAGAAFERAHLGKAACIHANSVAEAEAARSYGLRNPICVLPNGIEIPTDTPTKVPTWAEKLTAGQKVLLYLGRLHPKKGIENLMRAWCLVRQRRPDLAQEWELVVAGWDQGGYRSRLEALLEEEGVEHVTFVGPQFGGDKWASLAKADAFVLPSLSEGLPMAPLEAWAVGVPVLMTAECNLPDGFSAGAAIAVRPDPASIAEALTELFSMTDGERKAMGACGLKLVRKRFSWQRVAREMRQVYEWVLGRGSAPECVMRD